MMIRKNWLVAPAVVVLSAIAAGCAPATPALTEAPPTENPTAEVTQAPVETEAPTEVATPESMSQTATLHLIEHATTDVVRHIGPAEETDSVGDVLAFANEVFAEDNTTKAGNDSGVCVRTAVGKAWECIWTLSLKDGSLTVEGPFYDAGDSTLAITGGAGTYIGASGSMALHARNAEGSEYDFVYTIVTPSDSQQLDTLDLTVVEHADTDTVKHIGPAEETDSSGDILVFANKIFDEANANEAGSDNGFCIRATVGVSWECAWTLTLEDGSLTVEGPFLDAGDSVLAVTGGTGAYKSVAGQMKLHARNDKGTEYDFVYSLIFLPDDESLESSSQTVVEHADSDTVAHVGPANETDSDGDVLGFANSLFDEANASEVGGDNGFCFRTAVGSAWECMWTATLEKGQVTVQGPFYDASDSTLVITGGTGTVQSARGEMTLHARNDQGSEYDFGYTIVQ